MHRFFASPQPSPKAAKGWGTRHPAFQPDFPFSFQQPETVHSKRESSALSILRLDSGHGTGPCGPRPICATADHSLPVRFCEIPLRPLLGSRRTSRLPQSRLCSRKLFVSTAARGFYLMLPDCPIPAIMGDTGIFCPFSRLEIIHILSHRHRLSLQVGIDLQVDTPAHYLLQ